METAHAINVSCNHCGAPLSVPQGTRFVTCTYCGTQLQIHADGGAAYTEIMQAIDARTEQIAKDVEEIKARERIEQLDREWMLAQNRFMISGENGARSMPSAVGGVVGGVLAAVFGVFWMVATSRTNAPFFFPLFGLLFIGLGIAGAAKQITKASDYRQALNAYQNERDRLMSSMRRQDR